MENNSSSNIIDVNIIEIIEAADDSRGPVDFSSCAAEVCTAKDR
jgi:hypothetical protein